MFLNLIAYIHSLFKFKKTSDEELVDNIKELTVKLAYLGNVASQRDITVWLKNKAVATFHIIDPRYLSFDEAYKVDRTRLG